MSDPAFTVVLTALAVYRRERRALMLSNSPHLLTLSGSRKHRHPQPNPFRIRYNDIVTNAIGFPRSDQSRRKALPSMA